MKGVFVTGLFGGIIFVCHLVRRVCDFSKSCVLVGFDLVVQVCFPMKRVEMLLFVEDKFHVSSWS